MSSRRIQSDSGNISLFPFLAVLLCTMGSLIVILVVLTRQGRATTPPAVVDNKAAEERAKKINAERENLQWQIEQLEESLTSTAGQLRNDRLTLSNTEDAIRRLKERIAQLDAAAKELDQAKHLTADQKRAAEADLAQLRERVEAVSADLQRTRHELSNRPQSYAIIPYEGANGTRRRPIFIECTANEVILQPEGIRLVKEDFEEPLGPGNPLAAALRATREHLARANRAAGLPEQEPYPLIVVRPEGIAAYYEVRDAIKSWDADFGYELIGEDWKLDFPAADPQLAQLQQQAVSDGRRYQARLAAAAPSKYGRRGPAVYRASPTRGGLIREDGHGGNGAYGGGRDSAHGDLHSSSRSAAPGKGTPPVGEFTSGGENGVANGQAQNSAQAGGSGGQMSQPANALGGKASDATSQQKNNGFENNGVARAKNWALPDANAQTVPITRTVRVLCREDRWVIMPERGLEGGHVIMLKPRSQDSIDEFVSAMWEHMKGWGIAGNGLFWRPVLSVQTLDGGEQRMHELKLLLEDSGVEVREASQP